MSPRDRLRAAVVDTSVIFSIFEREPSGPVFLDALSRCDRLLMSAGTFAELSILVMSRAGHEGAQALDAFIEHFGIEIVPVDAGTVKAGFRDGFVRYGKGTGHPPRLNFGDLFAWALAAERKLPLYFQGADFARSEVVQAMSALGYEIGGRGEPRPPGSEH